MKHLVGMEKIMTYRFEIRSDKKIKHPKFRGNTEYVCHKYEEDYTSIVKADSKQDAIDIVKSLGLDPHNIERHHPDVPRMINLNATTGSALKKHKKELEKQLGVRISYSDFILRLLPV